MENSIEDGENENRPIIINKKELIYSDYDPSDPSSTLEELLNRLYNKEIDKSNLRIKIPKEEPSEKQKIHANETERRQYILEPLEEVILNPLLLDEILVRCSVPDLLEGREPGYSGVILFGPPGTGKTAVQKALAEVYERAGAYSSSESLARLNISLVGGFAQNIEAMLKKALDQAKSRNKPSFISLDEGSTLIQMAQEGASNVAKHYQESIDVLKQYIGNHRELVLTVSTNVLPNTFEEALTREGRLTSLFVDYPGKEERMRLWNHFLKKYNFLENSNPDFLYALAEETPKEQGAFIEEVCRNYTSFVRQKLLRTRGYSSLYEAMRQGADISNADIRNAITPETLKADVREIIQRKLKRNGAETEDNKIQIGF